jgi:hypothetical protein
MRLRELGSALLEWSEKMKALLDLFKQVTQEEQFDAITIGLASPEKNQVVVLW